MLPGTIMIKCSHYSYTSYRLCISFWQKTAPREALDASKLRRICKQSETYACSQESGPISHIVCTILIFCS